MAEFNPSDPKHEQTEEVKVVPHIRGDAGFYEIARGNKLVATEIADEQLAKAIAEAIGGATSMAEAKEIASKMLPDRREGIVD